MTTGEIKPAGLHSSGCDDEPNQGKPFRITWFLRIVGNKDLTFYFFDIKNHR